MFEAPKRGVNLNHLWVWLAASVLPMFASVLQCAGYNEMATEGKAWWEVLLVVLATQGGPFVALVADEAMERALVLRYGWIAGGMLVAGLLNFYLIKPSPYLFWKILAWVFYVLAVVTWFVLGQVALKVALS